MSSQLRFVTLDVFTQQRFAGNPLAVVEIPKNVSVSTEQMQLMAQEFNLSETVFLHDATAAEDGNPEWQIRIFMTHAELPFAGHPTIGTACLALSRLASAVNGALICPAGRITIRHVNGVATAGIPHDVHVHTEAPFELEQVCALQPVLKDRPPPMSIAVVSPVKGMNFICVELPDLESLALLTTTGVKPCPKLDAEWDVGFAGSYFYVLTMEKDGELRVRARMIEGLLEDPATGSAACALAAFLALARKHEVLRVQITQGVEMGRRSEIGVEVTLDASLTAVTQIELSGSAVKVMEGNISYA